jgi:hypothetical protein
VGRKSTVGNSVVYVEAKMYSTYMYFISYIPISSLAISGHRANAIGVSILEIG